MPFTTLDLSKQSGTSLPSSIVTASGLALGTEEYDIYVVTSSFSNIPGVISSNWSRFSDTGFEKIGTGVTQSSGIFTFPSTGKYLVRFSGQFYVNNSNHNRYFQTNIDYSNDSFSSSHRLGEVYTFATGGINTYSSCTSVAMVDITNTSTNKVRFSVGSDNDATWALVYASSTTLSTYATFEKLGDT